MLPRVQVALGAHCLGCEMTWVRVARGANCFGSFKCRVIALPRAQVALGAHCLGCEMLTQDDFPGAFQKLLERYIKCIAAV